MRRLVIATLVIMGVFAIGCGADGGDSGGGGSNGGAKPGVAKVGEPARDGKFEFTVQSVKCGVSKVGPDVLAEKAQGQFCLITVNVKNIGKESQTFSDGNQKGFTADGKQYSADTAAGIAANEDAAAFLNEINPGNQVTGVLVFDVPKDVVLAKLELHDSAFSGGVTVQLG